MTAAAVVPMLPHHVIVDESDRDAAEAAPAAATSDAFDDQPRPTVTTLTLKSVHGFRDVLQALARLPALTMLTLHRCLGRKGADDPAILCLQLKKSCPAL